MAYEELTPDIIRAAAHAAHLCAIEGWVLESNQELFRAEDVARRLESFAAYLQAEQDEPSASGLKYSPEGTELLRSLAALHQQIQKHDKDLKLAVDNLRQALQRSRQ